MMLNKKANDEAYKFWARKVSNQGRCNYASMQVSWADVVDACEDP